jgi:hypothetical protein
VTTPPDPRRRPFLLGLRRVDELDPGAPLPDSDPRLVERIAGEIREAGPMTFARFMELALYDPDAGYYTGGAGGATGPGRQADFLTAPEGHPIFGWSIARHLESVWEALDRPARFVVREHGAGSGALAAGILDGLRRSGSPLLQAIAYQAVDVAPPGSTRSPHGSRKAASTGGSSHSMPRPRRARCLRTSCSMPCRFTRSKAGQTAGCLSGS